MELRDMEIEANAFAMELLMPFNWIARDAVGLDLCDEVAVAKLAKRYRVPATAMAVRIGEVRAALSLAHTEPSQGEK